MPLGRPRIELVNDMEPGERFEDRFLMGRPLGAGGTSEVFEALDRREGRRVAVKLLSAEAAGEPEWRERFAREADVTSGIAHPNVLSVTGHGQTRGRPYLITELVEGKPLSALMRERERLTAAQVFRLIEQVLDGLEALHERGIVHRDLKPANILVGSADDMPVKITDFGVAKQFTGPLKGPATAQGMVLGTPAYMSPEAVAGQGCCPASDLYALAVILYELVVGEHPFPYERSADMLRAHLLVEPRLPWSLHPALRRLLERGLEKSPRARYTSVAEFRRGLRALECEIFSDAGVVPARSGPVRLPPPTRPSGAIRVARQARRLVLAMGVACATLITALAVALPALRWAMP